MNGKQKSQEYVASRIFGINKPLIVLTGNSDLHYLAISTHITELAYAISDIQTRIFGTLYHISDWFSRSMETFV